REHLAVLLHPAIRAARTDTGRLRGTGAQLARLDRHGARLRDRGGDLERSGVLHGVLPRGAPADLADARRSRGPRGHLAMDLLSSRAIPAADADDAVRAGQRRHQRVPHRRSHRGHDARRARQRQHAAALLYLSGGLQLLGHRLCGDADHGHAAPARGRGARSVFPARPQDSFPMSAAYEPRGAGRLAETAGAWLLGVLWILPLLYAAWAAFHPPEFSARFSLAAPV